MTTDQKRTFWQQHFDDWQKSELNQPSYRKSHNISITSFRLWRTRLKRETKAGIKQTKKLVPVTIAKPSSLILISLPNGIQMSIPVQLLAETMDVLSNHQQALKQ